MRLLKRLPSGMQVPMTIWRSGERREVVSGPPISMEFNLIGAGSMRASSSKSIAAASTLKLLSKALLFGDDTGKVVIIKNAH